MADVQKRVNTSGEARWEVLRPDAQTHVGQREASLLGGVDCLDPLAGPARVHESGVSESHATSLSVD